jgi:hypothetical protein
MKDRKKRAVTEREKGIEIRPVEPFHKISANPTRTATCQMMAALPRIRP